MQERTYSERIVEGLVQGAKQDFLFACLWHSALVYDILPPRGKVSESEAWGVWQSIDNDAMFMVF